MATQENSAWLADAAPAVIKILKDIIGTIELHTDCMSGEVSFPSTLIEPYIEAAEEAINAAESGI